MVPSSKLGFVNRQHFIGLSASQMIIRMNWMTVCKTYILRSLSCGKSINIHRIFLKWPFISSFRNSKLTYIHLWISADDIQIGYAGQQPSKHVCCFNHSRKRHTNQTKIIMFKQQHQI